MICVNELTAQKCTSRAILSDLLILLTPFTPHVAEELWHSALGNNTTICDAQWPSFNEEYLKESSVTYAVSFNGKARFNLTVAAGTDRAEVEKLALADPAAQKWLDGKTIVKIIVVPNKIVNVVVK
jgi:leucyl-tRNA synthetase